MQLPRLTRKALSTFQFDIETSSNDGSMLVAVLGFVTGKSQVLVLLGAQMLVELERLLIVGEKYRPGGGYQRTEGQLRRQLETSFAREAEIVFTTLSSSGREIFERLGHGFDTVVIDEAAQVSRPLRTQNK